MEGLHARLSELDIAARRLWEKQAASRYDQVRLLLDGAASPEILTEPSFKERYRALIERPERTDGVLPENAAAVAAGLAWDRELEAILLCKQLAKAVGIGEETDEDRLISLFLSNAEDESEAGEGEETDGNRVIYFRSAYADQAYKLFSDAVPALRADYAASFSGACEAVYNNHAQLCILPLENNVSGTMASFRNLIALHELKIVCTCDVATGEEEVTRFALLKKTCAKVLGQKTQKGGRFFRFTLIPSAEAPLALVLTAAQACGLSLYKTDAIPISYTERGFAYDITLHACGDLAAFLVYLTLNVSGFEAAGLYMNLEA